MAKNFVQPGDVVTITAGGTVTSGSVVAVGDMLGVALNGGGSGDRIDVSLGGVWKLPKVAVDTIDPGQMVFWKVGDSLVTEDADGGANKAIGYAFAAAGNGVGTVPVKVAHIATVTVEIPG